MELYRKELKLAVIKGLDESRGSSNVPIKLTHDTSDEYINYTEQIHVRYLLDNQVKEEILPTNGSGFYIPGKPLSHDGPIELAVHLINGDIELVTNELSFIVNNAPNGTTQVDPSEFTWQQLVDQYVNAKLDTFADKADMNKFKDDVNANLTNQNKKITDLQNTTKASLDSQNTKIDNFKSEVNTNLSNQNTSINQTTSAQNSKIATLESRMDTFTSLSSGSTTGDAELQDIRVGANGVTYPNAGDAVRGQYSQLKEDLVDFIEEEFDKVETINLWNDGDITVSSYKTETINKTDVYEKGKTYVLEASTSIIDYDKYNIDIVGKGQNDTTLFSKKWKGKDVEFTIPNGLVYVSFQLYHASTISVVYKLKTYEKPKIKYNLKYDALPTKLLPKTKQLITGDGLHTSYIRGEKQPASKSTYSVIYNVEEFDTVLLKAIPSAYYDIYTLLDSNENVISYKNLGSNTSILEENVIIPNNCKYLVVSGNPNTTLSSVMVFAEKEIVKSDFYGKKIVWFGTSIPAGGLSGYENELSYPMLVGNKLGAKVFNEAIGSSTVHCRRSSYVSNDNPYGFIEPFDAVSRCLSNSLEMQEWVINHFSSFRDAPTSLSESDKEFIRNCSYERKIGKYFNKENEPDIWVFDHGHNDYFGDESNYTEEHQYDCFTFRSAMNFLINKIKEYNPRAQIIFLYDYDDKKYPNIVINQRIVYDDWNFYSYKLYKDLGWTNKTVKTNGYWLDGFWYDDGVSEQNISYIDLWCADGLHPHSDKSRKAIDIIANNIVKHFATISVN